MKHAESGQSPPPPAMWEVRPDWLCAQIDAEFAAAAAEIPRKYGFHGTEANYQIATTTILDLADHQRAQRGRPLRILEVGCAAGHLLTRNDWGQDTVHGITAYDYRNTKRFAPTPRRDSDSYFIGNAERLNEVEGLLPNYDIILSLDTLMHLVDKVGTIEQMADRVAPGGLLCLDCFDLNDYYNFAPFNNVVPPNLLPKLGFSASDVMQLLTENDFVQVNVADIAPHRQLPAKLGEGQIVLQRMGPRPVRFGLNYAQVASEPRELLFIPTWHYVRVGEQRLD